MKTYAALYAPPIKKMTDENKALIYLGYRGSDIPEDVRGLIDFCKKKVDETAEENQTASAGQYKAYDPRGRNT